MLMDGTKVPFPEDHPEHPFWAARRARYEEITGGAPEAPTQDNP
jgi:hypothetical protein